MKPKETYFTLEPVLIKTKQGVLEVPAGVPFIPKDEAKAKEGLAGGHITTQARYTKFNDVYLNALADLARIFEMRLFEVISLDRMHGLDNTREFLTAKKSFLTGESELPALVMFLKSHAEKLKEKILEANVPAPVTQSGGDFYPVTIH